MKRIQGTFVTRLRHSGKLVQYGPKYMETPQQADSCETRYGRLKVKGSSGCNPCGRIDKL